VVKRRCYDIRHFLLRHTTAAADVGAPPPLFAARFRGAASIQRRRDRRNKVIARAYMLSEDGDAGKNSIEVRVYIQERVILCSTLAYSMAYMRGRAYRR